MSGFIKPNTKGVIIIILLTALFLFFSILTFGIGIWLTKLILVVAVLWFLSSPLKIPSGFWKWVYWIGGGLVLWNFVIGRVIDALSDAIWVAVIFSSLYLAYKIVIRSESSVSKSA